MKIVIAPQSFKGGLSGTDAAKAIQEGILDVIGDAETVRIPVADGGDGTLDALSTPQAGRSSAAGSPVLWAHQSMWRGELWVIRTLPL